MSLYCGFNTLYIKCLYYLFILFGIQNLAWLFLFLPCRCVELLLPPVIPQQTKTPYKSKTYKALKVARTGIEPVLQE